MAASRSKPLNVMTIRPKEEGNVLPETFGTEERGRQKILRNEPYPIYDPWDRRYIYLHEWLIFLANVGKELVNIYIYIPSVPWFGHEIWEVSTPKAAGNIIKFELVSRRF